MPDFYMWGSGEECTLEEVLKQVPAHVEPQDVTLEYAGCGSHQLWVHWDEPGTESLELEDPEADEALALERRRQAARDWEAENGVQF